MIRVTYTDGDVRTYKDVEQATVNVHEIITGCDFAVGVQCIEEVVDGDVVRDLACSWSLKIVSIPVG